MYSMYSETFSGLGMEIVFVSSDKDEAAFNDYFGEMPWVALPFEKRDLKETLSKKYKVQGIPSLVILGPDGKTITTEGRKAVTNDPKGEKYPWIPPTAAEKAKMVLDTLGSEAITKIGSKAIGIYFSAHWCPPCRGFTPKLAEFYTKHAAAKGFQTVFVSGDRDQRAFEDYYGEMPWLALPYDKKSVNQ